MDYSLWRYLPTPVMLTLGLLLIWQSLPLSMITAALLSLLWLIGMLFLWWHTLRRALPGHTHPCEVILVGGPAANRLMNGEAYREGLHQRWLRLDSAEQLAGWLHAGYRVKGLLLVVEPDCMPQQQSENSSLLTWQHAWISAQRQLAHPLPAALLIIGHFQPEAGSMAAAPAFSKPASALATARQQLARQWQHLYTAACLSTPAQRKQALGTVSALQWLVHYTDSQLLPRLLPQDGHDKRHTLNDIGWMESGSIQPDSPFQQEAITASHLQAKASTAAQGGPLPLPESLSSSFPKQYACPQPLQVLARLASIAAVFLAAFSLSSAWNNRQLIRQTNAAIQAYQALSPTQEPLRGKAVQRLQDWQTSLAGSSQTGPPLKLGIGLYQGDTLAKLTSNIIQSYHPPKPQPEVIQLDNTALFDSGKAELKPQAKLALQAVLVWIQANPGKRVLIDGHTDNAGSAASNLKLSLGRAQAVKAWLLSASTFPETHFAVQGLGDTKPMASNDDPAGRSQNRRVEITLIQTPG